jgi:hypothetical protein
MIMISDLDFEKLSEKSDKETEEILSQTNFEKLCEEMDHEGIEKLFWNLLRDYVNGKIPENTMSTIASDFATEPAHFNMSHEAKVAVNECIKLEYFTYFKVDEKKAQEIRNNLNEDVSDYFGVWYKNFE